MTTIYIRNETEHTTAACGNCGTVYDVDDLAPIADIQERVCAGEEMPAGQCPDEECGALCSLVKSDEGAKLDAIAAGADADSLLGYVAL